MTSRVPQSADSVRLAVTPLRLAEDGSEAGALPENLSAVGVPMYESSEGPVFAEGPLLAVSEIVGPPPGRELFERQGFSAKSGQIMTLLRDGADRSVVYVGCGSRETIRPDDLRRASANFVRAAGRSGTAMFVLTAQLAERASKNATSGPLREIGLGRRNGADEVLGSPDPADASKRAHAIGAQAVSEGAILGAYRFALHKSEPQDQTVGALIVGGVGIDAGALSDGVVRGTRIAAAVCDARDLVNEPPSTMNPSRLAEAATELFRESAHTSFEVWDLDRIEAEKLGGLMGVARGSAETPRLIRAVYEPPDPLEIEGHVPHVVLVGKGITFDSGGLSLKSADGMVTMKTDMSGAATVISTLSACGDLGVRVRVTAIAPVTENMPGGRATKPGDVLTIRDGQTIEVLNTDAEGRLILADGLSLARELEPDAIIDLATLTGAVVVALGNSIAGVFGNDAGLADRVLAAAARAGEAVWPLPLTDGYRSQIDSDVADMKNMGKPGQAGAITAALLLSRFVGETPWVHIDMAGPARSDENDGALTKGGTGFGVRTLVELLDSFGSE